MIKSTEVELAEDAPANVSGGTGINSPNPDMANIDKPMSLVKREKFADKEVFEVDDQFYQKCIHGKAKYAKYADYVGNDETGEAIRQYGRSNPKASILVKNKNTQNMTYLRRINEETGEEMDLNHRIDEAKISKRATIRDGENKLDKNIAFHAAWKEIPYGVSFVPASAYDREEFGKSTYRARKGEMKEEIIVKLDPKGMKIYFVDGEHYRNTDEVKWQEPTNLTKLVIYNKSVVENDGVPEINESMFGPGGIIPTAQASSIYVIADTKGKYKTIRLDADPQRHFQVPEDFLKDMEKNLKIKKVSIQQFDDKVGLEPHDDMVRAFFTKNANISESVIETATMSAWLAATGIAFVHGYYEMSRETYQKLRVMIDNRRQIAKQSGSGILTDYSKQINKITDNLEKIFNKAKITK